MKRIWEKTLQIADDRFNLLVIAILSIGFLSGIYAQGKSHDKKIDKLRTIYNTEVGLRDNELDNMFKAGDALFKAYKAEQYNSSVKDQIIEKQHQAIEQLLEQLNNRLDISRWI